MYNKIAAIAFLLIIIVLLNGCIKSFPSQASIYQICPPDHYSMLLSKETNGIMFNICLGFVFAHKTYEIELPSKPEGRMVYPFNTINIRRIPAEKKIFNDFTSGEIVVDTNKRRVSISLKTPDGDYPGNGEYLIERLESNRKLVIE